MAKFSNNVDKGATSEANSRVESYSQSAEIVQDSERLLHSSSKAVLTRTDKKRRNIEEREREMLVLSRAHILTCGDFVVVKDLANLLGIDVELLSSALRVWEANIQIFSIDHDGCMCFPTYAFSSQGGVSPTPGLGDVLSVLRPIKDGWGMAFWFVSPNGYLGGKRPQDLLSTEPTRVFFAAHEEAGGVTHG